MYSLRMNSADGQRTAGLSSFTRRHSVLTLTMQQKSEAIEKGTLTAQRHDT